jgi:hypothetical protein
MLIDTLAPLFAWSWSGHGQLTSIAIAYAIAKLISASKSYVLKRIDNIYTDMKKDGAYSGDGIDNFYFDEGGASAIQKEYPAAGSLSGEVTHASYALSTLPGIVQREDLHIGNIPWGIGEFLDSTGQVRHFMRSQPEISSWKAYIASREYIRFYTVQAWLKVRDALSITPGTDFSDKLHDFFFDARDIGLFQDGLAQLAKALHCLEDSYAPGHVDRIDGLNWIKEVHIWDDLNKNGDPSRAIPKHEEYDNPQHPKSQPFFQAAKEANGELIFCVLANFDRSEIDFRSDLDNLLARFLATCMPATG